MENFHLPFVPVASQGWGTPEPSAFAAGPLPGSVLQAQVQQLIKNPWHEINNEVFF